MFCNETLDIKYRLLPKLLWSFKTTSEINFQLPFITPTFQRCLIYIFMYWSDEVSTFSFHFYFTLPVSTNKLIRPAIINYDVKTRFYEFLPPLGNIFYISGNVYITDSTRSIICWFKRDKCKAGYTPKRLQCDDWKNK